MKRLYMSSKAKRVLYPTGAVVFVTFFSFVAHSLVLGTSSFPAGRIVEGRYLVPDHGKVIELTAQQYWFSYIHGVLLVAVFAIFAVLLMYLYSRGDLKDEQTTA
jgi:hypothetical protein